VIWADASAAEAARRSAWTSMLIDFGMVKSVFEFGLVGWLVSRVLCCLNDGVDVMLWQTTVESECTCTFERFGFVWCLMQERK
jgi:hypothetical protein